VTGVIFDLLYSKAVSCINFPIQINASVLSIQGRHYGTLRKPENFVKRYDIATASLMPPLIFMRLTRGPTKHRKEYKGANLFKNTRILTTRDVKKTQGSKFIYNYKDFNNKGV